MPTERETVEALRAEIENLRLRLGEAEETLNAIRSGEVDALVVEAAEGARIYTLEGACHPYRVLVESMNEGAATFADDGTILYCNARLAGMLHVPLARLIGKPFLSCVAAFDRSNFQSFLERCREEESTAEIRLLTETGRLLPVHLSCRPLKEGNHAISAVITDLSEKQRNEEIVASEKLASSIIEQAGEVMMVCNADGKVIRASKMAYEMYGKSPVGRRFDEVCRWKMRGSREYFSVSRPLNGEIFRNEEVTFQGDDTAVSYFLLNAGPLTDQHDRVIGCVVTLANVTERIQAEERARFQARMLDAVGQSVIATDINDRIVYWNKAASLMYGWSADEVIGKEIVKVTVPQLAQEQAAGIITLLSKGEIWSGEFPVRHKDGRIINVLVNDAPVFDDGGEYVGIIGVSADITERKREQEELAAAKEQLQQVLSSITEGYYVLDSDFRFVTMNAMAERHFGLPAVELRGKSIWNVTGPPEDTLLRARFVEAMNSGVPQTFEARSRIMPGYWAELHLHPRRGSLEVYFRDISERKAAEQALQRAHEELEQRVAERTAELADTVKELKEKDHLLLQQSRLAAMGEMISNIAHQWRQPLNVLGLSIQNLPLFYEKGLFSREFLDKTVSDVMMLLQHMSGTIDDFRNFYKPDKERVAFGLSEVVVRTVKLIEGNFESRNIAIVVDLLDDLTVYGYPNEYSQVILNILSNAKDAIEARMIKAPRIHITTRAVNGKSILTIADNAGGIPEDIIFKIFEPHFTTKGSNGTGIGLFMAKNIIEKNMNGRLTVRNTGQGAEFSMEV